jgi:hypothetical protein
MLCQTCGAETTNLVAPRLTPQGPEYLYRCRNGHEVVGDFRNPPHNVNVMPASTTVTGPPAALPSPPPSSPRGGEAAISDPASRASS